MRREADVRNAIKQMQDIYDQYVSELDLPNAYQVRLILQALKWTVNEDDGKFAELIEKCTNADLARRN